jgi:hypothetical protein
MITYPFKVLTVTITAEALTSIKDLPPGIIAVVNNPPRIDCNALVYRVSGKRSVMDKKHKKQRDSRLALTRAGCSKRG